MNKSLQRVLSCHVYQGNFVLSSGKRSNWYVDVKAALTDPYVAYTIHCELHNRFPIAYLIASGYGGYGIAVATGESCYVVRGKGQPIGQKPPLGSLVILIDDVYTTGKTFRSLEDLAAINGWSVVGRLVIVNRADQLPDNIVALLSFKRGVWGPGVNLA